MLGIASPTVVIEEIGPKPVFVSYISRITSIVNVIITRQKHKRKKDQYSLLHDLQVKTAYFFNELNISKYS